MKDASSGSSVAVLSEPKQQEPRPAEPESAGGAASTTTVSDTSNSSASAPRQVASPEINTPEKAPVHSQGPLHPPPGPTPKANKEPRPNSASASPVCQNCGTTNTPLWRRDESGQVLCNACGLFLKLHGRPRPISLKTDVIKSRNRIKQASGVGGIPLLGIGATARGKKGQHQNGVNNGQGLPPMMGGGDAYGVRGQYATWVPPTGAASYMGQINGLGGQAGGGYRNGSNGKKSLAGSVGTSVLEQLSNAASQSPYLSPHDSQDKPESPSGLNSPDTKPASPGDEASEIQRLKTRVSELELVNDLYKSRLAELESAENSARSQCQTLERKNDELSRQIEALLGESKRNRSGDDEQSATPSDPKDTADGDEHNHKKMRVADLL